MKNYLLAVWLSAVSVQLQASPNSGDLKTHTRQDTVSAIQKLFAHKRLTGGIHTMVGGCYLAGGAIALPLGAIGLIETSYGLIRQTRFRRYREEELLKTYQEGTILPKRIRQQLNATYFSQLTTATQSTR